MRQKWVSWSDFFTIAGPKEPTNTTEHPNKCIGAATLAKTASLASKMRLLRRFLKFLESENWPDRALKSTSRSQFFCFSRYFSIFWEPRAVRFAWWIGVKLLVERKALKNGHKVILATSDRNFDEKTRTFQKSRKNRFFFKYGRQNDEGMARRHPTTLPHKQGARGAVVWLLSVIQTF